MYSAKNQIKALLEATKENDRFSNLIKLYCMDLGITPENVDTKKYVKWLNERVRETEKINNMSLEEHVIDRVSRKVEELYK